MTVVITDGDFRRKAGTVVQFFQLKESRKKFAETWKRSLLWRQDIATELVGTREKSERLRPKSLEGAKDISFELRAGEALGLE